jgi:hypothetical protein
VSTPRLYDALEASPCAVCWQDLAKSLSANMADEKHVTRLLQNVRRIMPTQDWNEWRAVNQHLKVDLSGANLKGVKLSTVRQPARRRVI